MNVYLIPDAYCPRITRQRRTHRKKRINKKWRKRYGFVSFPDPKHLHSVLVMRSPITGMDSIHVYASQEYRVREMIARYGK